jgi:sigma-B regulation protein RsbU (phosphoserine phosphatase)
MRNTGLGFKLALYIISTTVVISGVMFWLNHTTSRDLLLKNVKENALYLTEANVNEIDGKLNKVAKIPENESHVLERFDLDHKGIKDYVKLIVGTNPDIFGSCVAYEPYRFFSDSLYFAPYYYRDGDSLRYESLGGDDYQYFYWDWYQIPKMLQQPVWSEPYYDDGGGNIIMCTYSVPFYSVVDGKKIFNGVVTVDISLEWIDELLASMKIYETGYAFLISSNGTIVSHPQENIEMNQTIFSVAEEYNRPELRELGRKMINGESGFLEYESLFTGKEGYMLYQPLSSTGWSLVMVFPKDELFADLNELNESLLAVGLIGLGFLLFMILLISQRITRPLTRLAKVTNNIGEGNFDIELPEVKSRDEIGQLNQSIGQMQQELKHYIADLKETTAAKERIESELKIAHDIQQGIIPKIFPPFPDREDVDLYAILDPARDVGGDLYDFFFVDDYKLCFAIGDVSGKGVPASLFMAITRTLLRAKAQKNMAARDIVKSMNVELCQGNENSMFVTFFLGIIDLKTGHTDYCNAGHNHPYLLDNDMAVHEIEGTHGTPLGIFDDIDYKSDTLVLKKGDSIVMYTDGITEAMNLNDELFTDERLADFLKAYNRKSPKTITMDLLNEVKEFAKGAVQSDDITILSLTYYLEK